MKHRPLLLVWGASLAAAFPSYRTRIPNGVDRVPCAEEMEGCANGREFCDGLGHTSCEGGGPRGPFGTAFASAGHKWTKEFCAEDSDGDGFTNGQELGDPCCEWEEGDFPSEYMASFNVTHPGE